MSKSSFTSAPCSNSTLFLGGYTSPSSNQGGGGYSHSSQSYNSGGYNNNQPPNMSYNQQSSFSGYSQQPPPPSSSSGFDIMFFFFFFCVVNQSRFIFRNVVKVKTRSGDLMWTTSMLSLWQLTIAGCHSNSLDVSCRFHSCQFAFVEDFLSSVFQFF